MLDITLDDINLYVLMPLDMHLGKQFPKWDKWHVWTIVDNRKNLVAAGNSRRQWPISYIGEKEIKKTLYEKIKFFKIVKPTIAESSRYESGKVTYIMNPLYNAKSLEEAKIRLDLMLGDKV